jgi:hypothetical protein
MDRSVFPGSLGELTAGPERTLVVEPTAVRARARRVDHRYVLGAWITTLGLCVGAAVISSTEVLSRENRIAACSVAPAASPSRILTAMSVTSSARRRSISVMLPTEADRLVGPTIPIAGTAFPRPHGVSISSVVARLVVRGRVVAETVLAVHRGRFAGTLSANGIVERSSAELHVARANRPDDVQVIRHLLLDPNDD